MAQQPESPPFSPSCSEGYFFEVRSVNISDAGSTSDDEYEFGSLSNSLNGLVHNKASNAFVTAAYPPSENNISTAIDTVARAANRLMMDDKYQANTNAKLEAQAAATNSSEYRHPEGGRSDQIHTDMDTQNSHNVYPIDTLIELGKSSKISRRALRFSEEAPAGKLPQFATCESQHMFSSFLPSHHHLYLLRNPSLCLHPLSRACCDGRVAENS